MKTSWWRGKGLEPSNLLTARYPQRVDWRRSKSKPVSWESVRWLSTCVGLASSLLAANVAATVTV